MTSKLQTTRPQGLGFFGSPYNHAENLPTPGEVGVHVGDSMEDVIYGVKGVGYYTDVIGFGESSNSLTSNMDLKPLGVNYFIKTGMKCSNGADMWNYMKGIPDGNALGKKVANAMKGMGLPALKGLAPGMIEDAESALNPMPLMNSLFGSGYPKCEYVTLEVGDARGRIKDTDGTPWIEGDAKCANGKCTQSKWVQAVIKKTGEPITMSRDQWLNTKKTHNAEGKPIQGFVGYMTHPSSIIVIGILCLLALGIRKS